MTGQLKPTALVLAHPFADRIGYFLAGLSHHYRLKIYYTTNRRFRFKFQIFYRWLYDTDAEFIECDSLNQVLDDIGKYEGAFVQEEAVSDLTGNRFENQQEALEFLKISKTKARQLFWLELGEQSWFNFGRSEFWNLIDGVLKGQVFKKEYAYLLKDLSKIGIFQGSQLVKIPALVKENLGFDIEKYRHKIIPFPFTLSIVDSNFFANRSYKRVYDIAANTRTCGNGALRYSIIKAIQENLAKSFIYSFDFDDLGWRTNLPLPQRPFDLYLTKFAHFGPLLFKIKYGKYFYPRALYLHNLLRSRCYLGLGWIFSSLRTADCWGAGTVLINFSFKKCEYGLPVEDGYNYISIGERDEYTSDNIHFKSEYLGAVLEKVERILGDRRLQQEIVKNQKEVYTQYFSSPQQFTEKILIKKIMG